MGFSVCIGTQQEQVEEYGRTERAKIECQDNMEDMNGKASITCPTPPHSAPPHPHHPAPPTWPHSHTTIHLYFWGGECGLLPPPGFFGLFLRFSNQLLDEAPGDDGEQGRRGGWRRALVLFSNLCVEARREVRVSLRSPQTVCDAAWEEPRGESMKEKGEGSEGRQKAEMVWGDRMHQCGLERLLLPGESPPERNRKSSKP